MLLGLMHFKHKRRDGNYMARIRIFAVEKDNEWINLLTVITEYSSNTRNKNFKKVYKANLSGSKILIIEGFVDDSQVRIFRDEILSTQELKTHQYKIKFYIDATVRESFLLQNEDKTVIGEKQIFSPFGKNAELLENWCLDDNIKNIWLSINKGNQIKLSKLLDIDLYSMIDRVGNLLHFKEINEVDISIVHQNDKFITFYTSMDDGFISDKYIAHLEIKSYDDIILKRNFIINERFIDFDLQDEDYDITVEVYNVITGKCVYKNTFIFANGISLNMQVAGATLVFKDQYGNELRSIQTYSSDSTSSADNNYSKVIQLQLLRNNWTSKLKRESSLNFKGFKGAESQKAVDYFKELLKRIASCESDYIYIADPYFLNAEFNLHRFLNYMEIFATVQNKEVRILTCNHVLPKSLSRFIKDNHNKFFRNIKIKSIIEFTQKDKKEIASFHDRWIASEENEYGFTNSLNNFKNGVSFFKSLKHYHEEAEFLWQIKPTNSQYSVKAFQLYEE